MFALSLQHTHTYTFPIVRCIFSSFYPHFPFFSRLVIPLPSFHRDWDFLLLWYQISLSPALAHLPLICNLEKQNNVFHFTPFRAAKQLFSTHHPQHLSTMCVYVCVRQKREQKVRENTEVTGKRFICWCKVKHNDMFEERC